MEGKKNPEIAIPSLPHLDETLNVLETHTRATHSIETPTKFPKHQNTKAPRPRPRPQLAVRQFLTERER